MKGIFIKTKCVLLYLIAFNRITSVLATPPNIIFILADDLGWNDVGFHGSAQIPTPNIDALAYSGLILNRYYVNPICTPSRSALMTGKYPIHTGMQHTVLYAAEPRGLPLSEKIMPEYLNELGYSSHIAGKWHLGHFEVKYTPLRRGFASHIGFWTGHHDYFDHTAVENPSWGLDIRNGLNVAYDLHGKYTTDIVTEEAVRVITAHNSSKPLFLYVAHAAVHSGNPYNPLPAPDETVAKMSHIKEYNRRKYAAMMSKLDDSVGLIVKELQKKNLLRNSIIVFSTDNGGPADGFNLNHASNWPLRGVKNTLWEGGVRGAGLLWSPLLETPKRVSEQIIHITDWLPTFLGAINSVAPQVFSRNVTASNLDGINLWTELSQNKLSKRKDILHNIDDIWGSAALTMGDWKVVIGSHYNGTWDGWYGPAGLRNESSYNTINVFNCPAGVAISKLGMMPKLNEIYQIRKMADVNCTGPTKNYLKKGTFCRPMLAPCLFNVKDDPCEQYNLAERYPRILKDLLEEMNRYNSTAVPAANQPSDPMADPRLWHNVWTNFGDFKTAKPLSY